MTTKRDRNRDKLIVNELGKEESGDCKREEVKSPVSTAAAEDPRIRRRDSSFSVSQEASGDRGGDERKAEKGKEGKRSLGIYAEATA